MRNRHCNVRILMMMMMMGMDVWGVWIDGWQLARWLDRMIGYWLYEVKV